MIRCTVYDSAGEELFREEDGDRGIVAFNASERARTEYPHLSGVEWRFEMIYPEFKPHEPPEDREEWDEYVQAYRAELEVNDDI